MDDAFGVEVVEHFWAKGVYDFCDAFGEALSSGLELDDFVAGPGVHHFEERSEGFKNIHCDFAEAEGGVCDDGVEDDLREDEPALSDAGGHVAHHLVPRVKPGDENDVDGIRDGRHYHSYEQLPRSHNVPSCNFDTRCGESLSSFDKGDVLGRQEDQTEEGGAREHEDAQDHELEEAVPEEDEACDEADSGILDLVVSDM